MEGCKYLSRLFSSNLTAELVTFVYVSIRCKSWKKPDHDEFQIGALIFESVLADCANFHEPCRICSAFFEYFLSFLVHLS